MLQYCTANSKHFVFSNKFVDSVSNNCSMQMAGITHSFCKY